MALVRSLVPHQFVRGVKQVDFLASQAAQDAKAPRPYFALTAISPLPTGLVVPVGGELAVPVFALKGIDDRSGVQVINAGATFRVSGDIFDTATLIDGIIGLAAGFRDVTPTGGNGTWFCDARTRDDMGATIEDTLDEDDVSSNLRKLRFAFGELERFPGLQLLDFEFLDFELVLSHNFGTDRTADCTQIEVYFAQHGTVTP